MPNVRPGYVTVALGNPGRRYRRTRHNVGQMALDRLLGAADLQVRPWRERHHTLNRDGRAVLLYKPQTFMNECGSEVAQLLRRFGLPPERLLVLHDDLDLPLGRLQARFGGGDAGHLGLRSIAELSGSKEFYRLRIGIGRPTPGLEASDYVLTPFTQDELKVLTRVLDSAVLQVTRLLDAMMHGERTTHSIRVEVS